jgi:hypothetical protein
MTASTHSTPAAEVTLRALGRLLALTPGWDSYGALPVDPACALAAWHLLTAILREDSPAPAVVPTVRGGVQLEWHVKGVDLEIEVGAARLYHVAFEDNATGEAWEKELPSSQVGELATLGSRLSPS